MISASNNEFAKNRAFFCTRFPELARIIGLDSDVLTAELIARVPQDYLLVPTPSGIPTISVKGTFIQSKYDPARDARRAAEGLPAGDGLVFAGIALALLPELWAQKNPASRVVIVEPDLFLFLLCLASRPLDALFAHRDLVIMAGTPPGEVCALLERLEIQDLPVYENPAITGANKPWFDEWKALRARNREKREINANTLKRFGELWLSNMSRNLARMRDLEGIMPLVGAFADVPALVLAAGPSLDRILPLLGELRKKCLVIAVDTAVRACVRAGVEPDFIVLVDPQYWNWRHLDGVSAQKSILITESAAWPAVFRFRCRNIFLCSSLFPLGRFLEDRAGRKGELGAGGSVSTTAWDFARHLGCRTIYMAALDLGFPGRKTHFTGSIFEDRTHTVSGRLAPAETALYCALYGAGPYPVPDYRGGTVLTDRRLILYAWWFESRLAKFADIRTATLTPEGVKIPGFDVSGDEETALLRDCREEIDLRLDALSSTLDPGTRQSGQERFNEAFTELLDSLRELEALADEGISLCGRYARKNCRDEERSLILGMMNALDGKIIDHRAKEIVAMVFTPASGTGHAIELSERMYRNLKAAARKNLDCLSYFTKELGKPADI